MIKDWQRYEIKFTVPSDSASTTVYIRAGLVEEKGTAYFDCLQVEDGSIANRYNIVENPSLTYGTGTPTFWTKNTLCDTSDTLVTEGTPSSTLDGSSFKLTGIASKSKCLYQTINISGNAGDVFSVGGWAKGNSVPLASGRYFALDVGFQKYDGSYEWHVIPFNEDSSDWQYVSDRILTAAAYKSVNIYALYYNNENAAYFDNIQLYKEEFEGSYQYDSKGNVISTTDLANQKSTFEYSSNNDLVKSINPKGGQFNYIYDSKHNILSAKSGENVVYSFTYDVYGNPVTSKVGDSTLFLQSEAKYNSDGNNVTNGNYITELKDPSGNVVKYNYNQTKGTLDTLTDAKGKVTSYQYDSNLDRLESVSKTVDGNTITNNYTYENDRIKTINHNGFSYIFDYDSFGNVKSVCVGTQELVNNTYDASTGNLTQVNYGNGQNVSTEYDELDRIKTEKYNGTARYNYEYDGNGNLGYHEDLVNGINYRYIYDISDRLVRIVDSNGNTSGYGYDPNNNLEKFTEEVNRKSYITSYSYDNDNRITKLVLPNSNNISYTYDTIGRVKTSTITIGSNLYTNTYDYDNGGKLNKVTLPGGKIVTYTHDANGNIETVNDGGKNIKYYYNELNELLREDNEVLSKTIVYSYDVGGNILSKTEYPYTTETPGAAIKTYSYTYGDANWKDVLTAFDGKAITYDAIGNLRSYDGYEYTWEEGRQLKSITKDSLNMSFKYNSDGIRTEKNVNGVVTKYHLVGDKVTFESNGTESIYYTYDNSNNLVSINLNGTEYYYVRNGQGDITGLLDGSGNQVVSYTYDSWGKLISIDGSLKDSVGVKNPYRYRGYRYDTETGLYYLNSRYYNPEWGRFLNADSIIGKTGELLSHNFFAYAMNNPVNMDDPSGYLSRWAKVAIGVGVIAGLGILTIATAGTGTALACFAVGAFNGAVAGAAGGALSGGVIGGAIGYVTGGWDGAKKGFLDGAADGFMTGAITGAISGGLTSKACFVAGTQIATADGEKPIEEIKPGDMVYSYDEETGEVGLKPVVQTFVKESSELVHIKADGQMIDTTNEHPFYVPQKGWTEAIKLRAGDKLLLRSGKIVIVEMVRHEIVESPVKVYNFEVADWHTYYVSDRKVLVHNACAVDGKSHGSATHRASIDNKVSEMSNSGKYSKVYVNKSLKKAGYNGRQRPDIIGVRNSGGIDIFEYASPSQMTGRNRLGLIRKFNLMRNNNPGSGGELFF